MLLLEFGSVSVVSDDLDSLDHRGALEHLRRFAAEHGMDPRIDLAEVVMHTFRSWLGRAADDGDRVPASAIETTAVLAWSHVDDVTSAVPCPSWCAREAGHPYQDEDRRGNLTRDHSRRFGPAGDNFVEVSQLETALGAEGPVSLAPAEAHIWISGNSSSASLDAASCLVLGRALDEAAQALKHVTPSNQ